MGLTGIIYGGIVALWLCYLVPLALRRYDEAARTRSIDRFSSAMRVLGRANPQPTRWATRRDGVAHRPLLRQRAVVDGTATEASRDPRRVSKMAATRAARAAAARRRRVLAVLLAATGAVGGAAGVGLLPSWSVAVPGGFVLVFLVVARSQVRRARMSTWERALRTDEPGPPAQVRVTVEPVGDQPDDAPTEELAAVLMERQVVAAAVLTVDGDALWDPLPVTLPTYVSKPRAERSIRTVDLTGQGARTPGRPLADADTEVATTGVDSGVDNPVDNPVDNGADVEVDPGAADAAEAPVAAGAGGGPEPPRRAVGD